ncbi:MAG: hypothetical protein LLG13_14760 [Bacteroidales bacterium]|nr:hypothetical protein [Bacteroidales bacterium]
MKKFRFLFVSGVLLLALGACQRDEIAVDDNESVILQETLSEEIMVEVDALVEEAIDLKLNTEKSGIDDGDFYLNSCPIITYYKNADPQVIIIDFGTGCQGKDGKVRSGKIMISSSKFENATAERVKTFDDFYVEGKKVEGVVNKTITVDREDHIKVAEIEEDLTFIFPDDGGTAQRKAIMTRKYELNTLGVARDNIITSWGVVEFTRVNGIMITKTINETTPLIFKVLCHRIVSGIVAVKTSDNRSWTIDYGNGECDNIATVMCGNNTKIIRLR